MEDDNLEDKIYSTMVMMGTGAVWSGYGGALSVELATKARYAEAFLAAAYSVACMSLAVYYRRKLVKEGCGRFATTAATLQFAAMFAATYFFG